MGFWRSPSTAVVVEKGCSLPSHSSPSSLKVPVNLVTFSETLLAPPKTCMLTGGTTTLIEAVSPGGTLMLRFALSGWPLAEGLSAVQVPAYTTYSDAKGNSVLGVVTLAV